MVMAEEKLYLMPLGDSRLRSGGPVRNRRVGKLIILIRGPDHQVSPGDSHLGVGWVGSAQVAAANAVVTADSRAAGSCGTSGGVGAAGGGHTVEDVEDPGAGSLVLGAGAGEVFDNPVRGCRGTGGGGRSSRGSESGRGGEDGSQEDLSSVHCCGWFDWFERPELTWKVWIEGDWDLCLLMLMDNFIFSGNLRAIYAFRLSR